MMIHDYIYPASDDGDDHDDDAAADDDDDPDGEINHLVASG